MRTKKLSILLATTLGVVYGNAETKGNPSQTATSSFIEVANNTIYHHSDGKYADLIQTEFIDKYMNELADNPNTYIKIISHTDNVGDWETNLNTSKKRAIEIAEYFGDVGVPNDRIILDWLGADAPLFYKKSEKYKNARTNIRIIQKVRKVKKSPASNPLTSVSPKPLATANPKPRTKKTKSRSQTTPVQNKTIARTQTPAQANPNWRRVAKEKKVTEAGKRKTIIKTPTTTRTIPKNEDLVAKGAAPVVWKSIMFINANTNVPIQVEVDLATLSGKVSASTSSKGELKVDINNLQEKNIDVYAYGYFFKSVRIEDGSHQQIVKLQPTDTGKKIELKNLQFVPGKAMLLQESNAELNRLYLSLMMNPKRRVEIGGHINVPGKTLREITSVQMQLSVDRAKSVYDYLVGKGIPKKQLTYKGYGNSEMLFPEPKSEEEKSKNRRVEVKIIE